MKSVIDHLKTLGEKSVRIGHALETEEATKTALVMPFIKALGYDVYDPEEVVPEYTADFGIKRGEKVDFAIKVNNQLVILIECKKYSDNLDKYTGQLYRYFSVTGAKIGILTDGRIYKFYSDLEEPNKLDKTPFYILDLGEVKDSASDTLEKFTKERFDLETILNKALDLKYVREIKTILKNEFKDPTWLAMELVASSSLKARRTQNIIDWFARLTRSALQSIEKDHIRRAMSASIERDTQDESEDEGEEVNPIETTMEEVEGFHFVKAIVSETIKADRVFMRDTRSYCGILVDNNNRKPLCRLHFNNPSNKSVTIGRSPDKIGLDKVSDIIKHKEIIRAEAVKYISEETAPTASEVIVEGVPKEPVPD